MSEEITKEIDGELSDLFLQIKLIDQRMRLVVEKLKILSKEADIVKKDAEKVAELLNEEMSKRFPELNGSEINVAKSTENMLVLKPPKRDYFFNNIKEHFQ